MATVPSTIAGLETNVSDEALEELRAVIRGYVLTPGDEAYERVRAPYNAMQIDRPGLIVQCAGSADVVDAVNFARSNGLEVAVRGGRALGCWTLEFQRRDADRPLVDERRPRRRRGPPRARPGRRALG